MDKKDRICVNCAAYDTAESLCRKGPVTVAKTPKEWCNEGIWTRWDAAHSRWQSVGFCDGRDYEKTDKDDPTGRSKVAVEDVGKG